MTVTRPGTFWERLRLGLSLGAVGARIAFTRRFPLVAPTLNVPVPRGRGDRGTQLDSLREIADGLGVREREGDGIMFAARRVGCVTVEAHVPAEDTARPFHAAGMPPFDEMRGAAGHWAASNGGRAGASSAGSAA